MGEVDTERMVWLGCADPLGAMEEKQALDETQEEFEKLIAALTKHMSVTTTAKFTVADLTKLADTTGTNSRGLQYYKRQDLRELMTYKGKLDGQHFSKEVLMKHRDKLSDSGWQIKVETDAGTRVRTFYLLSPDWKRAAPVEEAF